MPHEVVQTHSDHAMIDTLNIGFLILEPVDDQALRLVHVNHHATMMIGQSAEALLGRTLGALGLRGTIDQMERRLLLALETTTPTDSIYSILADDSGEAHWWQVNGTPSTGPHGPRLILSLVDITAPQRAADHLQQVAERFWLAFRAAQDGIWDWNLSQGDMWLSSQWKAIVGYADHELENSVETWNKLLTTADGEPAPDLHAQFIAHHDVRESLIDVTQYLRHRNGSILIVRVRGLKIIDDNGAIERIVGAVTDITKRSRAEAALAASEQRFRDFSSISSDWLWETDAEHRYSFISDEIEHHIQITTDKLIGLTPWEFAGTTELEPDLWDSFRQSLAQQQRFENFEYRIHRHEDGDLWVRVSGLPRFHRTGQFLGYRGTATDITEARRSQEQLRLAASVFDTTQDAIVITDAANNIITVNPAFSRITGYAPDDVIGQNPRVLSSGRQGPEFYAEMWRSLIEDGRWSGELWNRRKDGVPFLEWSQMVLVRDAKGQVRNHIAAFSDITQRRENEDKILFHANFDVLTKLPNRRLFSDRLAQALLRARRARGRLAVLFLDLDGFKFINDTMGHAAGDKLLVEIAHRLTDCLRDSDTVARFGGDEFTIILPDVHDAREVALTGYRILRTLAEPLQLNDQEVTITTSIGASIYPDDANDADALCRHADQAMYDAKNRGKNDMAFFTEDLDNRASSRLHMENSLRRAIDRGEFVLYFQPKIALAGDRLVSVETLVRWAHPERGIVSPAEFIPLAEESGLILPLSEWVMRQTCQHAFDWIASGEEPIRFALNASPVQFSRGNFVGLMDRLIRESGIAAELIEVEVTEGTLMKDPETAAQMLHQLRSRGVKVALDDFGTGYSSLAYLTRLPLDSLKIDKSFVANVTNSPDAAALAASIIGMGKSLRLNVVAEGVETVEQLEFLRHAGCHEAQGYYFARPMPYLQLAPWLHNHRMADGRIVP